MKTLALILFLFLTTEKVEAVAKINCHIVQTHVSEAKIYEDSLNLQIKEKAKKSKYLSTVFSQLNIESKNGGVLIALRNGITSEESFHKFQKNKKLSKTFELPSQRLDGISNRIRVECSK